VWLNPDRKEVPLIAFITAVILILLIFVAALCFKVSNLLKQIIRLNYLIRDMLDAGVSPKAARLAVKYYENEKAPKP
jgi:hypothetical protein